MGRTFPTGALGYWTRRLADGGLVAAHRDLARGGCASRGRREAGRDEPARDRRPLDRRAPDSRRCSMGNLNWGDVLTGRAARELAPFGGEQAHKAFALAVGLQLWSTR